MVKTQGALPIVPPPQGDPGWLLSDPEGAAPPPPVQSRASALPFDGMEWKDFERLCRRLAERIGEVEQAWAYGTSGQAQFGIDILVRLTDGTFEVWQTKRYRNFKPANVRAAVALFMTHKWAARAKKFVLAVACDLDSTTVVDAIEAGRDQLRSKSIAFEPLDRSKLTDRLRVEAAIVDDFFGRPWAQAICPPEALQSLANRVSRFDRKVLRNALRDCYASWAATVDPGLPIAGLDRLGRALPAVPIANRYVKPDIVLRTNEADRAEQASQADTARESTVASMRSNLPNEDGAGRERVQRLRPLVVREQRMTIDRFLAGTDRAIITGDAGAGKSTLLRMLALDILSDAPQFDSVRDRYADYLPVWVSFPLWARMALGRPAPPPLEDVIAEFFRAQSRPELAAQIRKALNGPRTLLLIDGLDEASDPTAAQTVASVLSAFVEAHGVPSLMTSRPHGLRVAGAFAATWTRAELAPLSDGQRHSLAKLWFRVLEEIETEQASDAHQIDRQAERRATSFTSALQRNPGIARLSQTPLFLLALMELHRHGHQLPRSRFAAIEKIVEQLVDHQPQRRATDSLLTVSTPSNARLRDRLIADFAFGLQSGELTGAVTDAATEDSAVFRASKVIIERLGTSNHEEAETLARSVLEFAEERAGLLVKKAARDIGFLHLSIQEFLAGRHLVQRSLAAKVAFIQAHAGEVRWREPILYLLYLVPGEVEIGELIRAIEQAPVSDAHAESVREALLTDAVFADLAHDIRVARKIAARLLSEAELTAWGARQRHLLSSVVDGLSSEAVAVICSAKIAEWMPNRHGYQRAAAIRAMGRWQPPLRQRCFEVFMRSLAADEPTTRVAAAEALSRFANEGTVAKHELLKLLKAAPSIETLASTLYALGCGWAMDADVGGVAAVARNAPDAAIAMEGLRIRAKRIETDDADFERFFATTYRRRPLMGGMASRDLIEHFAVTHRATFIARLHEAIDQKRDRNPHDLNPLIGSLVVCDPEDSYVAEGMIDLLKPDWNIREIFAQSGFPSEKVPWTPALVAEIERFAGNPNARLQDYELYWIAKVVRSGAVKLALIRCLQNASSFRFWAANALTEFWGGNDPEVRAALLPFLDAAPGDIASVAGALPHVIDDEKICRAALLRALRGRPRWVRDVFNSLRRLGVSNDDQEAFEAALDAWTGLDAPLFQDQWRTGMILTFPRRPEVKELALEEMMRRDGDVGAVAESYLDDDEMIAKLLRVLAPQPESAREVLVSSLQTVASANDEALVALDATRQDTEGSISSEATIAWVEALLARGTLGAQQIEELTEDLTAVGPDYEARRVAAVAGLAIAGHLDRFATAIERQGDPLRVSTARASLRSDDRYLRRFLLRWDELIRVLGGEVEALERLQITPDVVLPLLEPSQPNAQRLFDLLLQKASSSPHLHKHVLMSAMARFAPTSAQMRELILPALTSWEGEYWARLIAGEIFAEHFADDSELRGQVIEHFVRDPRGAGAGALAELVLRRSDPELENLLREKTGDTEYDIATHFKLVAAVSTQHIVVEALDRLLTADLSDIHEWQFARWVPAMVRRIEKDAALQGLLHLALTPISSASVKISFVSLLGRAAGVDERLRAFAVGELDRTDRDAVPEVGFDLSSQTYHVVRHRLFDLIG